MTKRRILTPIEQFGMSADGAAARAHERHAREHFEETDTEWLGEMVYARIFTFLRRYLTLPDQSQTEMESDGSTNTYIHSEGGFCVETAHDMITALWLQLGYERYGRIRLGSVMQRMGELISKDAVELEMSKQFIRMDEALQKCMEEFFNESWDYDTINAMRADPDWDLMFRERYGRALHSFFEAHVNVGLDIEKQARREFNEHLKEYGRDPKGAH